MTERFTSVMPAVHLVFLDDPDLPVDGAITLINKAISECADCIPVLSNPARGSHLETFNQAKNGAMLMSAQTAGMACAIDAAKSIVGR